jgi:hypothetical protein
VVCSFFRSSLFIFSSFILFVFSVVEKNRKAQDRARRLFGRRRREKLIDFSASAGTMSAEGKRCSASAQIRGGVNER